MWSTILLGLAMLVRIPVVPVYIQANPGITLRVYNPALVPAKSLAQAERIAGQIFADAGIELTWVNCDSGSPAEPAPCARDRGPATFQLQILGSKPADSRADVMGFAVLTPHWQDGDCYAAVSYPMVEAAAKSLEVEIPQILGAAVAHEIGHLFLGPQSHSPGGVMSPRLRREQLRRAARGELRFTPAQAAAIRTELAALVAR